MVSSRSGLVDTSATGVSISSCTRWMYLIACAGRSAHDRAPAVRVMPHARLGLNQPDDLALPPADICIVDESAISALIAAEVVEPSDLRA